MDIPIDLSVFCSCVQYMLPGIVHIKHQPRIQRGDGPIVSLTASLTTRDGRTCICQGDWLFQWYMYIHTLLHI